MLLKQVFLCSTLKDSGAWNFRNAVESEGFNYHSLCLEDKQSQVHDASAASEDDLQSLSAADETVVKAEPIVEEDPSEIFDVKVDEDLKVEIKEEMEEEVKPQPLADESDEKMNIESVDPKDEEKPFKSEIIEDKPFEVEKIEEKAGVEELDGKNDFIYLLNRQFKHVYFQ